MFARCNFNVFKSKIMVRISPVNSFSRCIYDRSLPFHITSPHPQKKLQKMQPEWEWRTRSYLAGPPSAATSETSRSSGSLVDWGCKFYVSTSVPALAPVLHTTARSSKAWGFHYLIILFAINNVNSWNQLGSLRVYFFFSPGFDFLCTSLKKKYYQHLIKPT